MSIFHAIILGVVEGITEFLPISSTGHLILVSNILRIQETQFLSSFEIAIQLGAVLALLPLAFSFLKEWRALLPRILVAFLPTAILGVVLYPFVKELLASQNVVLWSLFLGGIFLCVFETRLPVAWYKTINSVPYFRMAVIGFAQAIAFVPGVSRAASTIAGGLYLRLDRRTAVLASFLLAVPTMGAATGFDLLQIGWSFTPGEWGLVAVGFIVSFLSAYFAVNWLLRYIQTHSFRVFGVYRILLALIFWAVK